MSNNKFIVAIPARLDSKRLPGKVLKLIGDHTMVYRVMKNSIDIPNIEITFFSSNKDSMSLLSLPLLGNAIRSLFLVFISKSARLYCYY